MVFGNWHCPYCNRTIVVGTVAPRSVMYRHCETRRHRANKAKHEADLRLKAQTTATIP